MADTPLDPTIRIVPCSAPLAPDAQNRLREGLLSCPDLAFTYLADVEVEGHGAPSPTLFVWLEPRALGSVRSALDLVAGAVARSLPSERYLDVVILNSAPELLDQVSANAELISEGDPVERNRALAAVSGESNAGECGAADVTPKSWWRRLLGG